ncbi:MAG: DCC1-like thiol-disulfide oxidoreductase family protein [Methylococcaceae bacterium]|nr:DCC1-like thiol-disulfide oxidoreductase family protein [Methylococcaceae bacterium]
MHLPLFNFILSRLNRMVPATGLGLFRIGFGLVALQEIIFLFYFRHLIFDPVPYLDRASPVLHVFLLIWMVMLACLVLGYQTRRVAVANYVFWVVFVVFTPMWQDFDGGFDQLMTASSFLLIFLPSERALSLDNLRLTWRYSAPGQRFDPPREVSVLAYTLPLALTLGLLYFDSGLHKLSSEFWRNGMGAWLPATHPYYLSPLDMSPLLNLKWVEQGIGYAIIAFQLVFLFLFWFRPFRVPLLLMGASFHAGIILSLNVYPFGFAMLVHYLLLVPFAWWRRIGNRIRAHQPLLTVFYDQDCPLCNRTVIFVEHFDIRRAIVFKGLQTHAREYRALDAIPETTLLTDLYSLDTRGRITYGLDTYIQILLGMGYTAPLGWIMKTPGVHHLARAVYRKIADSRERLVCGENCEVPLIPAWVDEQPFAGFYARYASNDHQIAQRIAKALIVVLVLQFNSTVHYGLLYRWAGTRAADPALALLDQASDSLINLSHTFFGISPHALYLHDHFDYYNEIVALSYRAPSGQETWLPFINSEGRLLAPNWGRIQSMWANVAITSRMSRDRLEKFAKKVTAFYGIEMGLDLAESEFVIKAKHVEVPTQWEYDLRHRNLAGPWRDIGTLHWGPEGARLNVRELPAGGGHRQQDQDALGGRKLLR